MARTILIIEDEKDVLEMLSRFFSLKGISVLAASSISEAKNLVEESDIVLSDIRIGPENGIEFLQELRRDGVDKPFLMMSGSFSESEGEKAVELTGHPVIWKPANLEELFNTVNKLV